jgi:hypothetical protein
MAKGPGWWRQGGPAGGRMGGRFLPAGTWRSSAPRYNLCPGAPAPVGRVPAAQRVCPEKQRWVARGLGAALDDQRPTCDPHRLNRADRPAVTRARVWHRGLRSCLVPVARTRGAYGSRALSGPARDLCERVSHGPSRAAALFHNTYFSVFFANCADFCSNRRALALKLLTDPADNDL